MNFSTLCLSMSGKWGSNPRPSAWEADALPTELLPLVSLVKCLIRTSVDVRFQMYDL